jgi:hypothetical protein
LVDVGKHHRAAFDFGIEVFRQGPLDFLAQVTAGRAANDGGNFDFRPGEEGLGLGQADKAARDDGGRADELVVWARASRFTSVQHTPRTSAAGIHCVGLQSVTLTEKSLVKLWLAQKKDSGYTHSMSISWALDCFLTTSEVSAT